MTDSVVDHEQLTNNLEERMLKIRHAVFALGVLLSPAAPANDVSVSIGIGLPHASIGFHVGDYPRLVAVPGYPVYYAPRLSVNLFFYDGMYWVFHDDDWYASYWYDGPWWYVRPVAVPVYILRVPVRYYRNPPHYFRGWRPYAPPRWGDRWGRDWERRRSDWDRWDSRAVPPLAPLPAYQRRYRGDDYPRQFERQRQLQQQHYRYRPRDPVVRQHYEAPPSPRSRPEYRGDDARRQPPPPPQRQSEREYRDRREYRDPREYRDQREFRDRREQQGPGERRRDDNGRGREQERGRGRDD
ncbi:MAG TPA: hypothetical protein VGD18_00805 [Thiobacillaceae bacterium]